MCGKTMPCAPLSRTREACQCSRPATRTTGVMPTASDADEICAVVSRSSELCSPSMNSQSKPAVLPTWPMLTVRERFTPRPMASLPARSCRSAWLGTAAMVFSLFERQLCVGDQLAPEREVLAIGLQQPLGRRAFGRVAVALHLVDDVGPLDRGVDFFIQPRDDFARHFGRAVDAGPLAHADLRHAGLVD